MTNKISEGDLIGAMVEFIEDIGEIPTTKRMDSEGPHSSTTYRKRFGSWEAALEAAGYDGVNVIQKRSTQELIDDLKRLAGELGTHPRYDDVDEYGKYSTSTYENRFGTWGRALEAAGYEKRCHSDYVPTGEDHPRWKGKPDPYYGPNWDEERKEALERDGHKCTIPDCEVTSEKSKERFGRGLHVHHIDRIENFRAEGEIDYESANSLSNLVTLCAVHHTEYEGLPLDIREIVATHE